jgi:hypothetical protein
MACKKKKKQQQQKNNKKQKTEINNISFRQCSGDV